MAARTSSSAGAAARLVPAPGGRGGRSEAKGVARVVVLDVGVADLDVGGDVRVQRPADRFLQRRRRHAADLEAGGDVGQQFVLARRAVGGHSARGGLGGHDPFGDQQLGEPPPQLPSFAGSCARQCGSQPRCAQPCFAQVDVTHQDGASAHRGGDVLAHRTFSPVASLAPTVTFTAGV